MKKIAALSTALFLSFASFAQSDSTMNGKKDKTTDSKTMEMSKTDGVMMENGAMMTVKKGKKTNMTTDLVCKNGTRVTTKGSVSKQDGSQMMLKEGEYMDVCGKAMPVNNSKGPAEKNNSKTSKDKNMYMVPDSTLKNNN